MLVTVLVFLSGLILGSFLNVCIYRIPRGESVVRPRSRCPGCGYSIPIWQNVPLLSYLLLRGKCAQCGHRIGWVYPTVELATGLLLVLLYWKYGLTAPFFVNCVFFSLLVALSLIDLFERILPDVLTLSGTVVGFLIAPLQSEEFLQSEWIYSGGPRFLEHYLNSFAGIVVGGGFLWLVAYLYLKWRKIEGMGFGDVKLMAMVGAFLGWKFAWLTIFVGSMVGALIGSLFIVTFRRGRMYELPFGTFLAAGAIVVTLYGPDLLDWYFGLME